MPVDAPSAPAAAPANSGITGNFTPKVGSLRPERGRREISPEQARKSDVRNKLNAVANDMSEGKFTKRGESAGTGEQTAKEPAEGKSPTPHRREDGKFVATKKEEADAPAEKKTEPTDPDKTAAKEKASKLSKAKQALALDGWEPEDIAELASRDEAKLLRIGEHRAKNQGDVNREFAKLREAGKTAPAAEAAPAPKAEAAPAKAEAPAAKAEPAKTSVTEEMRIIDEAAEEIGPKGAEVLKAITSSLLARLERAEAAAKGTGEVSSAIQTEMLYSQVRQIIEADYPEQSGDPSTFDEVAANFQALVASGRYGRGQIAKAWRDAGHMAFSALDHVNKAQRDMLARQAAADKGRVDSGRGDKAKASATDAPITDTRTATPNGGPDDE